MLGPARGRAIEPVSMMLLNDYSALATPSGEGLDPELHDLLERAAAAPFSEGVVRCDGMLQAGPNPRSENRAIFAHPS
jgi:hypothetical protein